MATPLTIETGATFTIPGTTITIVWTGEPISSALLSAIFVVFGELIEDLLGPIAEIWDDISGFLHFCILCDVLDAIFGEGRISKEKDNIQKFFTPYFVELHNLGWSNDRGSHFDEHADAEGDLRQDPIVWAESQQALRLDTPMIMDHMFGSNGPKGFDERFTYQYWDNAWGDGWSAEQRISAWNIMIIAMGLTPRGWPIINVGSPDPIVPDPEVTVACSPECVTYTETVRSELHASIGTVQYVWVPTLQSQVTSISGQVANIDFSKLPQIQGDVGNIQGRVGVIEAQSLPYIQRQVDTQAARTNVLETVRLPGIEDTLAGAVHRVDAVFRDWFPYFQAQDLAFDTRAANDRALDAAVNARQDQTLIVLSNQIAACCSAVGGDDEVSIAEAEAIAQSELRSFARTQELVDYNRTFTTPKVTYLEAQNLFDQQQTYPSFQRQIDSLGHQANLDRAANTQRNFDQDQRIRDLGNELEYKNKLITDQLGHQANLDRAAMQAQIDHLGHQINLLRQELSTAITNNNTSLITQIQNWVTNFVAGSIENNNATFFVTIQNYVTTIVQTCCDRVQDGVGRALECFRYNWCGHAKVYQGMELECWYEDNTENAYEWDEGYETPDNLTEIVNGYADAWSAQSTGRYKDAADRAAFLYTSLYDNLEIPTLPATWPQDNPHEYIYDAPDPIERASSEITFNVPVLLPGETAPCAQA